MADSPEVAAYKLEQMDKKLDAILTQVKLTNGRVGRAEDDIIRLQERTNPWTAGGVVSGLAVAAYAIWEKLAR